MESFAALAAQVSGLPDAEIKVRLRPPLSYQSNRLYDVWTGTKHLIAKEFLKQSEMEDAPQREYGALRLLAPLDIAPQPVFFDAAAGPVVFYEFMEGEMLDRRCLTTANLARLAEVWLKVHSVATDHLWYSRNFHRSFQDIASQLETSFRNYAQWVEDKFKPGRRAAKMCLSLLERRREVVTDLACMKPVLCFCRADPRFANVIRRPDGRLGLVDWEDSGLRDPARDLADILTHPNQEDLLSMTEWQAFLEPYLAVRGELDKKILHRATLYLALFPIFWLGTIIDRGVKLSATQSLESWKVNDLPANLRLKRYLARALAWPDMDFSSHLDALREVEFFPAG